ncbi:MAG: hypothetical protein H6712_28420 [Myxococcales bacterium]|nr:hypothetical protein [Myxococcales bacterium]
MASSLDALGGLLAMSEPAPNLEARALSPTVGWLVLVCVVAFIALCILHADRFRRLWMRAEDPRTLGLFRILFGLMLLLNLSGMWEQLEFLFTDEGLFYTDTARRVLGGKQFAGYGEGVDGEAVGFFGPAAILQFLEGPRYSLLMFRSDPTFFWIHLWAYVAVVVVFILGWRARLMGLLAFALMTSLTMRNPIYMTGADVVFKVFFFLLVLSRSGHAYSLDNWLRCRRLRRAGRLSEPGGPGEGAGLAPSDEHPKGLEAIYRRIPAWPRLLMMMQLATIYFYTGCAKTGSIWAAGDSLYYALNLDHFYRAPPQLLSSLFGTNLFRLMTWGVHVWQIGFPLVLVGLVARFQIREGFGPGRGWRRHATRLLWMLVGFGALGVTVVALPVHYEPMRGGPSTVQLQWLVAVGWALGMVALALGWRRLRDRPLHLRIRGRERVIDLESVCTWLLGRRLWLTIGLFFHVQIFMLMNIGMFAPIMIMVYLCCLNGTETASILRSLRRALARLGGPFAGLRPSGPPVPAEDPSLPQLHRDAAVMPAWALGSALAAAVALVLAEVEGLGAPWPGAMVWLGLAALVIGGLVGWRRGRRDTGLPADAVPWAYGPLGRGLATVVVVTHIGAVALHCIPDKDSCFAFRREARETVAPWLRATQTDQSWGMFAPNPLRSNVFLKVLVTDEQGEVWDLRTDANSPRNKDIPWIWYDRAGKITRRVNGDGKWYRRWFARYHCRRWALDHGGELPRTVELVKVWYSIPTPEEVAGKGYYRPADLLERAGHEKSVAKVRCAFEEDGQLTNELRERHGFPSVDEGAIQRRNPRRQQTWERNHPGG